LADQNSKPIDRAQLEAIVKLVKSIQSTKDQLKEKAMPE
jgi:hypothetical protein